MSTGIEAIERWKARQAEIEAMPVIERYKALHVELAVAKEKCGETPFGTKDEANAIKRIRRIQKQIETLRPVYLKERA